MKTICCTLLALIALFSGCAVDSVERRHVRTEETAIIACEAAHVTILAASSEQAENIETGTTE